MSERWFDHDTPVMADINVTPLVDVALVLLVVFMITAPMLVQGASVQLPRTAHMDVLPQDQLVITITAEEQIQLNDDVVALDELSERLSPRVTPGRSVLVYADESVQHGLVMQVVATAHSLGASIGIVTEPIPDR
jgi:biopolymer transport protein TolR